MTKISKRSEQVYKWLSTRVLMKILLNLDRFDFLTQAILYWNWEKIENMPNSLRKKIEKVLDLIVMTKNNNVLLYLLGKEGCHRTTGEAWWFIKIQWRYCKRPSNNPQRTGNKSKRYYSQTAN